VVIACVEELAREHAGKVVLVGNSLGGALSLFTGHERPDLCAGVVGLNPAGAELSDEGCGHIPQLERPAAARRVVADFVRGLA